MKRTIGTLLTVLALATTLLTGCANAVSGTARGTTATENGTLTVTLPILASRSVKTAGFGMTEAKANADTYTIFAYNASRMVTMDGVANGTANTLSLPADTYTVLVFAGDAYSSGVTLLGSGIAENVVVTANQTTKVGITLDDLDYKVTYPESVSCGNDFEVSVSYCLHGAISSNYIYASINNGSSIYTTPVKATDTDTYSGSLTFTAPAVSGTSTVTTRGYVYVKGNGATTASGKGWVLPQYNNAASYCQSVTVLSIPITESATGMNVTVSWADE